MPQISIKRGVSVVRLYDGERRQIESVCETLRSVLRAAFEERITESADEAVKALVAFVECFPEPEAKPKKSKRSPAGTAT